MGQSGKKTRRSKRSAESSAPGSSDEPYDIVYFRRHRTNDPTESVPGREFLHTCPAKVRATIYAVLEAVSKAPPHRFAGGGYWEAMHGDMKGLYEVRVDGPGRRHYRLICLLDRAAQRPRHLLVVVAGLAKPFRTTAPDSEYS